MTAPCTDNYVYSCNPAPLTPVSEVVVVRPDVLPATGHEVDPLTIIAAVTVVAIGAVLAGSARKKETS